MFEIDRGMISFPLKGEDVPGYLAVPEEEGSYPGIVLIQEWWGLVPHIKDVADRFAWAGFAALAPDLYHGKAAEEPDEARKLAMELERPRAIEEIQAAADYLRNFEYVRPKEIGVVGWCMGGSLAISMAAQGQGIGAVVVFYGSPSDKALTEAVRVPLLGLYGEKDSGIPLDLVQQFDQTLEANAVPHEIHVYAGAPHAFFNDSRPHIYRQEAAEDAWERTINWLRTYLG